MHSLYFDMLWSFNRIGSHFGCDAMTIRNRFIELKWKPRSSAALKKGVKHSKEHIEKRIAPLRGRKRPGVNKGYRPACIGWNKGLRKATHPDKITYGKKGKDHWAWKGGISHINSRIRQSSEYKVWRDAVFLRDNWTCQLCRKRGGVLEADHIKQFATHPDLRFTTSNGRTLCKACHKVVTQQQRRSPNLSPGTMKPGVALSV